MASMPGTLSARTVKASASGGTIPALAGQATPRTGFPAAVRSVAGSTCASHQGVRAAGPAAGRAGGTGHEGSMIVHVLAGAARRSGIGQDKSDEQVAHRSLPVAGTHDSQTQAGAGLRNQAPRAGLACPSTGNRTNARDCTGPTLPAPRPALCPTRPQHSPLSLSERSSPLTAGDLARSWKDPAVAGLAMPASARRVPARANLLIVTVRPAIRLCCRGLRLRDYASCYAARPAGAAGAAGLTRLEDANDGVCEDKPAERKAGSA